MVAHPAGKAFAFAVHGISFAPKGDCFNSSRQHLRDKCRQSKKHIATYVWCFCPKTDFVLDHTSKDERSAQIDYLTGQRAVPLLFFFFCDAISDVRFAIATTCVFLVDVLFSFVV